MKNEHLGIGSLKEEDDNYFVEDKRNGEAQKADTHWNQKIHMSPMSLLLWWLYAAL